MRRLIGVALLTLGAVAWSAPESCPPEAELQGRLGPVTARVDARVRELETGFELSVTIDDQARTLVLPTCAEALESTVFLVELSTQPPVSRRPLQVPVGAPPVVTQQPPEVAPLNPPSRFHLAAIGGAELLLLPAPVARFGLLAQVELGAWRVMAELRTSPPVQVRQGPALNAGVELTPVLDAQAGLCHLFAFGLLQAGPCVQAGMGLVNARGLAVNFPRVELVPVWLLGAGLRASLLLTSSLELLAFSTARLGPQPQYAFDGVVAVKTSPLGIDTGLGFGARF